jgi:hypothetical protein
MVGQYNHLNTQIGAIGMMTTIRFCMLAYCHWTAGSGWEPYSEGLL